jgi:2-polyprenyl-3-methyl-5-hydroxy-6-metoxy-1,4-benzoquinol methylase
MRETNANSGLYDPLLSQCPLCASPRIRFRYKIRTYTPEFTVYRCLGCGFMFMNPRYKNNVMMDFYGPGYYSGKSEYSYHDERDSLKFFAHVWNKRIGKIRTYVETGNFLDVGCSFGGFLKAASRYFTPHGIEVSLYAAAYAKSLLGDAIHAGTLSDHPFPAGHFSVITMIELLEHLPDPVSALAECHVLLRRGGLLVIQTANMDGLQAKILGSKYAYFMPGHVSYFSRKSLVAILQKTEFHKIKCYFPVEFGLLPKLLKSRHSFTSPLDYRKWLRIAAYHCAGKIRFRNFAATSSMVIYAIKRDNLR